MAHDNIEAGDVLGIVGGSSRQYVFRVGDTLYADRTPRDEDGEYMFAYGTGLIELSACPLSGWRVVDHYGSGSVEDGRAWRRQHLIDREPTPEHVADLRWRREHGYGGE